MKNFTRLALTIPGYNRVDPPIGIRSGGLDRSGGTALENGIIIFLVICVLAALLYMLLGSIQWIMSGGDKNKIQAARNKVVYAIIGLVVVFLSFFIVGFVGSMFGLELIPQ